MCYTLFNDFDQIQRLWAQTQMFVILFTKFFQNEFNEGCNFPIGNFPIGTWRYKISAMLSLVLLKNNEETKPNGCFLNINLSIYL